MLYGKNKKLLLKARVLRFITIIPGIYAWDEKNLGKIRGVDWASSALAIYNAPTVEVIRRHFYTHQIAQEDADVIPAHTPTQIGDDLMAVFELHPKLRSG